jgi:hypothetical protein
VTVDSDDFVLPPDLADKYRDQANLVHAAPTSEKLDTLQRVAQRVAGLGHPDKFPRQQAIDRLWATAEAAGLIRTHGDDAIQQLFAVAFSDPLYPESVVSLLQNDQTRPTGSEHPDQEYNVEKINARYAVVKVGRAVAIYEENPSAPVGEKVRMLEPRATVAELEAIFGRHGGGMASHYPRGRSGAARQGGDAQACEREANIYSRTFASGTGRSAKRPIKTRRTFCDGGRTRTRTLDPLIKRRQRYPAIQSAFRQVHLSPTTDRACETWFIGMSSWCAGRLRYVRFPPHRDQIADIPHGPHCAIRRHMQCRKQPICSAANSPSI